MRDQYVGDVSDFFKYHFIRSVAGHRKLGIAWFYIDKNDGKNDGKHIEWHSDQRFELCDPELAKQLSKLDERSLLTVEKAAFWPPGTNFHREPIPSKNMRSHWSSAKRTFLKDADFIFCDPDNGIGSTSKHLMIEELRSLRQEGRSVAFITFPARIAHQEQVERLHDRLHAETGASNVITVRTSISIAGPNGKQPRARWFTILDGDTQTLQACRLFGDRLKDVLGARTAIHESSVANA